MARTTFHSVCIFYTGDDLDDREFAQDIANQICSFCSPQLINVDELERLDIADVPRPEGFQGVPIYVLSPSMLRSPLYRQKLVKGTPNRNLPGRLVAYICRGLTTAGIRNQYPDLEQLFLDLMVGEEADLPSLVEELKAHIKSTPEQIGIIRRLWLLLQLLVVNGMFLVGIVGHYAYLATFLASLWLLWSLLLTNGQPDLEIKVSYYLLYSTGYSVNRVRPFDLWPWLGPAWSIGNQPLGNHQDSCCTQGSFLKAIRTWHKMVEKDRMLKLLVLIWLMIPGLATLAGSQRTWAAGAAAFVGGLVMPRLWAAAIHHIRHWAYWNLGMTDEEMRHTARFFSYWGNGITTKLDYRYRSTRGGQLMLHRPWLRKPPNVFISYVWRDEERIPVAAPLQQMILRMGVPCFLDRCQVPGKFASWRTRVADGILNCTHLFIVLGPHLREAHVMHSEIRTALQRWNTELEPSVVCVIDPEVALTLGAEKLSSELQYLLHEAPKITYAEAVRPDIVAHLLRQRTRQGLLQDWLTLLWPANRLRRFLDMESVAREEIAPW